MCQAIQSYADLQQHAQVFSCICCSDVVQKISNSLKAAASSIIPASKPKQDETARPLRIVKEKSPDAQLRAAVQGTSVGMLQCSCLRACVLCPHLASTTSDVSSHQSLRHRSETLWRADLQMPLEAA